MNITKEQMNAIRRLLSKEDKESIGMHTGKSVRTVDAVLQYDRVNQEIEEAALLVAKQNLDHMANVIADIAAKNTTKVTLEEYRKQKESGGWSNGNAFNRYMDIYLQLTHIKFGTEEELWEHIWASYKDIISNSYYCIDLFTRLLGIGERIAVEFFNKKTQNL